MNDNMFSSYPDVVQVKDLMEMLHIGRNSAYDLLSTGKIKTIRVGRKYIIPKRSVISYILTAG